MIMCVVYINKVLLMFGWCFKIVQCLKCYIKKKIKYDLRLCVTINQL